MKTQKQFWQFLWHFNWIIILSFWLFQSVDHLFSKNPGEVLHALAGLFGFAAGYLILVQFFLMGRNYWLEKTFGLDKLSRLHHDNGRRVLYFLVLHPILMILSYGLLSETGFFEQFWLLLATESEIVKAVLAWTLFFAIAGISIWTVLQSLRYEIWYLTHLLSYFAILLVFSHQFNLGYNLTANQWFYYYWVLLYAVVFLNLFFFRFVKPIFNFARHGFFVSKVVSENYNTNSIYVSGRNLDQFRALPGQFMIFRFLDLRRWWEAHPFSLSKPNNDFEIRITPKAVGNFTRELRDLKPGTKVIIEGPYGVFIDSPEISQKILLIAGGIGITPLRSLAEEMTQKGKDVVLLFVNKTSQDIVFEAELKNIPNLRLVNILSDEAGLFDQSGQKFETGYIDKEKIQRLVFDFSEREVFLCGPGLMMSSVRKTLKEMGHPANKIHFEKFSL